MTTTKPLGIYIHWPFCLAKCPYCDFNSHVFRSFDENTWADSICTQLSHAFVDTSTHTLTSIFFGGGTPSLLTPAVIGKILSHIDSLWTIATTVEISLEGNPTSLEIQNLPGYRTAGINRLSLGVQSLRQKDLEFLGRQHSRDDAVAALKALPNYFDNYSFDLIYARPNQTLSDWQEELEEALTLVGPHISVYQLTIEPGTAFHTRYHRGEFALPNEETASDMYDSTHQLLEQAGLPAYETSNHAQPHKQCQHNLIYWRYEDYIGVGPGAHGRITKAGTKWALTQAKAPEIWLNRLQSGDASPQEQRALGLAEMCEEYLFMSLRIYEGINRQHFKQLTSYELEHILSPEKLAALESEGLICITPSHIKPTAKGFKMVNSIWQFLKPTVYPHQNS